MDLVTPGIGMIFWSTLFFLVLLFILGKFAWPAILTAVRARNESIRLALEAADRAKEEMAQLQDQIFHVDIAAGRYGQKRGKVYRDFNRLFRISVQGRAGIFVEVYNNIIIFINHKFIF